MIGPLGGVHIQEHISLKSLSRSPSPVKPCRKALRTGRL